MAALKDRCNSVFICCTHSDRKFVERLAGDLRSLGCEVWLDEWKVRVGDSLLKEVGKAITDAKWMVVVLSPAALASEWVNTELRTGLTRELREKNVFVLPVLRKKVALPEFLRDRFYADFTKSYEQGLSILRDRIVGDYIRSSGTSWLLVKNPLPRGLLSASTGWQCINPLSAFTGTNVRQQLRLFSELLSSTHLKKPSPYAEYLHETMHLVVDVLGTETWFGNSGRLVLRRTDRYVHGEYDWHGLSFVGRIEGQVEDNTVLFDWSWTLTTEKGRGIFWSDVPNVLHGGWWADFEQIDEAAILSRTCPPPNAWEFVRVPNLTIQDDQREVDGPDNATDR
jgi:hypothetical protein